MPARCTRPRCGGNLHVATVLRTAGSLGLAFTRWIQTQWIQGCIRCIQKGSPARGTQRRRVTLQFLPCRRPGHRGRTREQARAQPGTPLHPPGDQGTHVLSLACACSNASSRSMPDR